MLGDDNTIIGHWANPNTTQVSLMMANAIQMTERFVLVNHLHIGLPTQNDGEALQHSNDQFL